MPSIVREGVVVAARSQSHVVTLKMSPRSMQVMYSHQLVTGCGEAHLSRLDYADVCALLQA